MLGQVVPKPLMQTVAGIPVIKGSEKAFMAFILFEKVFTKAAVRGKFTQEGIGGKEFFFDKSNLIVMG
jgi:hypothetical protein